MFSQWPNKIIIKYISFLMGLLFCILQTEHDFLIGKGLEGFMDEQGFTRVDPSELITERSARRYQDWLKKSSSTLDSSEK